MERIDGSLRRALRGAGVPDAGALAAATRVWPDAVGDAIARAAWPQRIARDGTLHVTTVSSSWAFELQRMEREIHAKLHAAIGDATPPALRFAPGPVPSPGGETRAAVPPVSPTPAEMSEADVVSAAIDDPGLRDAVRRTVAAGLARGRADRGV